MEGLRTKAAYSGTAVKSATSGSYEMGKSCALKTWRPIPRYRAKGYGNIV